MGFLSTPGSLQRRAEFYHQLSTWISAGGGLVPALQMLLEKPPPGTEVRSLRQVIEAIERGDTFAQALRRTSGWMPSFDLALLEAGEQSGRLDGCFKLLADYYTERARLFRGLLADLGYPLFVLHAAVFIFPFAEFFTSGNMERFLGKTFGLLLPAYALVLLGMFLCQEKRGDAWRRRLERLLRPLPVLGNARHEVALGRLAAALEALVSAGMPLLHAWPLAAAASGSPLLRRVVEGWQPAWQRGQTPADTIRHAPEFPRMFADFYRTAEATGKFDDTLRRLAHHYQEEGSRHLRQFAQWVPRLLFLLIALGVGYKVVAFYADYFQQINDVMK